MICLQEVVSELVFVDKFFINKKKDVNNKKLEIIKKIKEIIKKF